MRSCKGQILEDYRTGLVGKSQSQQPVSTKINLFTIGRFTMYDWDYSPICTSRIDSINNLTPIVHRTSSNRKSEDVEETVEV